MGEDPADQCTSGFEIGVRLELASEDGAFSEAWEGLTLHGQSSSSATLNLHAAAEALSGGYEFSTESDTPRLLVALRWEGGDVSGDLSELLPSAGGADADSAVSARLQAIGTVGSPADESSAAAPLGTVGSPTDESSATALFGMSPSST